VDDLTGTLRRGAGLAALEREIGRARRHGDHLLTVAFIDLDSLKSVNDSSGHAAGDALLCELAGALTRRLRAYDLVVRWGGDEFVVALSHAGTRAPGASCGTSRTIFGVAPAATSTSAWPRSGG